MYGAKWCRGTYKYFLKKYVIAVKALRCLDDEKPQNRENVRQDVLVPIVECIRDGCSSVKTNYFFPFCKASVHLEAGGKKQPKNNSNFKNGCDGMRRPKRCRLRNHVSDAEEWQKLRFFPAKSTRNRKKRKPPTKALFMHLVCFTQINCTSTPAKRWGHAKRN